VVPLDPEVAAYLEGQKKLPPRGAMSVAETREFMRRRVALAGTPPELERVEDRAIARVPCRIYSPGAGDDLPLLLFFHGGRFFSGDLETHDPLCRTLAAESGCRVVAADYRLAPEHKFPAAVEDAIRVTRAVTANNPKVAVCGDSAGANLAAVVAREESEWIACQALVYPMIDATCSLPSYAEFAGGYGPGAEDMRRGWREYMPPGTDPKDPRLSPLWAVDLLDLPPAFILTAECDTLRDEGEEYARRLSKAGVSVTLSRYEGMIHGFLQLGSAVHRAQEAISECARYLRDMFGLPFRIPVTDVLDLHTVPPRDVKDIVEEYLEEARRRGFTALRIIHGHGIGVQRKMVRAVLSRTAFVADYRDAPQEAGGWGATLVTLSGN
jgi:acetyl esterase